MTNADGAVPSDQYHSPSRAAPHLAPAQHVARRILGSAWWARFTFNGITSCERRSYAFVC